MFTYPYISVAGGNIKVVKNGKKIIEDNRGVVMCTSHHSLKSSMVFTEYSAARNIEVTHIADEISMTSENGGMCKYSSALICRHVTYADQQVATENITSNIHATRFSDIRRSNSNIGASFDAPFIAVPTLTTHSISCWWSLYAQSFGPNFTTYHTRLL